MNAPRPTLHMLCGKVAAGKSTFAANLAAAKNTVLIVEDEWLAALFAEELKTPKDYLRCTRKLRRAMAPHLEALLNAGMSVVLDFQANTVESRTWMRNLLDQTDADHQLHVLMPPDEVCLERLQRRNASGLHPFTVTEEQFRQISAHFVPPTPEEGFNLLFHADGNTDTGP
ncbi:ATP-binding protein [uncultured Tateyamaria sp.]|uniref:AAA family ATPase n=1 Tax=uncultured Tateyamaria sp. TaxID=455651 RepID=UPI00261F7C44|nr:ATP-binding protein [uncultured Tateyamaria sp.]